MLRIGIVFLGVLSTLAAFCSGSRCFRDSDIEPPYLLCYHTGKISLNETDVGNCTHLILTNVVTKNVPGNKLLLGEGISEDLSVLKEKNPNLVTIFTLNVGKNESTALLESTNKTKHLVEEISSFLQETTFDGLELNFEFTTETGGSKHSYTSFVKVLSKSLNFLELHRRTRRSYEVVEKEEDEEDVTKRIETTSISGKAEEDEQDDDRGQENADEIDTATDSETSKESGNGVENHEGDCENRTAWLVIRLPVKLDVIGKKYDLKALSRYADLLSVSTYNIVNDNVKDVTYHPSRLMGLSDIYNTDSILDFILGMGATKSRIVIGLPATAIGFHLKNSTKNTPGSPVVSKPTTLNQAELCSLFKKENWTLERDEDLTAPYAYAGSTWLAFEDEISVSIKGKYILLRELGGGAIYPIDDDVNDKKCTKRLKTGAYLTSILASNFRNFGRKPRALVLESLQNEIHDRGYSSIEAGVKLSEYRIVRVVDHSGAVHVIRRNTKTQFECSRQGYFSHPLGCNRFYRCVKFDQYSDEFTVFEYNCPAGLAFDERWEVCVWPGSLPNGAPCTGSSEIAPVPRSHYQCPSQEGYYGDPENCRWFFACLDHARDGITPLTAYEFRCPFGLVFNQEKLACDWPWIVGSCGNTGGVGYLGLSSAVHTSTFLNGGNLEASYGQYGKNAEEASFSSFGRGFGSSLKNANGFSGAKGGQSGEAGIGYIASNFDGRDSNRAPFASYPDFEISGGRVHNKGGVILQENVNFGGFQGTSYGKTGGLDFSTQSYGRGSLNSFGGLPSGVSLTSKDESVGGLDISGYASGHGSANPLNSFSVSTADSGSNLYKQSAEGSAFDAGSGPFKASQNEGLYKGSNRDGTSGSLFGKAYGYGASAIQQNIQLKSTENGGVYGDRSSNIRTPTSPSVVPIAGISLSNQSPYSYVGSSLSDKSLHKTYQQAEGGSSSDRLLNGNLQQSSGVLIGELYTTSRDSNANTPTVTIGNSVTLPQSSYPNIKPVNPSTSTLLNTPAASFVSSTIEPISHVKVTDHLDIRGGTNFGDISYSLPHLKAATTPSPFATTVGSTATTEAQLFVPVKTERPEFKQASFGHSSKYTISSTVKPFATVSSTASSVNTDEQSLRESSGTAFRDTGFGNSKNSFPTSAFGSYDNSVSGVPGSSYGKAFGTSYESQGSSGSFTSPGDIALSGDHSSTDSSLGGRLSSHSFGKSLSNSNVEVTDGSKFSTGDIAYDKGTGKITGSATGGLSGGAGISPYVNSAGTIVLTSAQQGRFQTGSTALGESSLGSIGSSSLFNTYESKTAGDGLHQSFGAPALSDLGKSTAGSLSTAFGNSNQKSDLVYGSVADFGSSNGYLLGKGFDKSILGTSSADGVPFNSFGGQTTSSTNFGKSSDTVTVSQLAQSNTYGRTGTESSSDFLLKGSNAGTSDASVGSVFIGTSGVSSGDAHTGISGTFFDESHIGTSGASLGSSTLDSPSTSHKELSGGAFFGSSREKIINKGYKIPHAYFPDASLEGSLVTSHKNLGIPSSEVSHGITTPSSTNSFDGTSGSPLSKTFEAPGQTAFGTHLQGGTSFRPGINAFGQTSQDSFQHSVTGSSGASFGVSGGGSLNPFSSGSTFTNAVGASYGTKLVSSVANTFDASAPDSLPNRYEDFVKGSLEKTYGMPVMDSTLTSHGSLPSLFGTSGNAGITSYGGIQPNSEQSDVTFVPPGQTLKVTISAKNKKPDFNLNADYEKLNDNFITAPGLTSKPTVKPFESFYSGSKGDTFKTQVEHQNEGGNNFNSYSHLNLLKQTTTNSFGQTGSGKDANRPFDTLDISMQTYGEGIKFSNQGTNFEQSHTLGNSQLLAAKVNQSAGISNSKIIEHSLISNSFGSQHSGNSLGSSDFSTIQGGGQTFKIVVPNIQPSYALDTSEKFQHATDVMVEKQPIVQVAGIEPVGYDYKESFQETITSKGLSKGSGSFSYGGVKTVASQPNHVSTVTSAPAITTFAPLTYKHGHTTASTTPLHLRPDYLEPIIHNRTQLIRTKVLVPVVTTTTQLPTAQSKIHLTSPKASDVNLKPLLPTQVTYTSAQYSQHGETSSTSLYRDGGNFEKAEPEAQNVVEVTPKPVIYHGTFETIGNKHVVIQSEESSASNQDSLNNAEQQRTESNSLGQKPGVYSYPSHFPGGTYYNEQLLENAKPTIQTTTKFLTTTEPYKSSLQTNTFSHQQLLPTLPSATSLPETTFYTNVHQSDFNQFELAQIKTNSRQHDGVLSHPSTNNQFHLPVVSQSPDTSSSKFKSTVPATEYRSPSTETTTSGLGLSQFNFKATSLGHQHPAATFDYSSNPLESYGKFFQQFNRSDSSFSLKDFGSSIRGTINPKIEISPPPKEYILNQQLGVQIGGNREKAQVYSTNEGSDDVRGFPYASRGSAIFQDSINGKDSYQTTITGGRDAGQVPDLYKGRYGKVITDEAFGEKLSGLHYDVMKTNSKTRQKSKGRQYHETLVSDIPATNKYEEYEIENQKQFENSVRSGASGPGRALTSNIDDSYEGKAKKTVFVSQTSDANPILVGKLAGQCSCQSNLLQVKETKKQSTGAEHKSNKQGNDASAILKYTEAPVTGTPYTKGSTLAGLDGHNVDYLPTGSPSFQPDEVVSIAPGISTKTKQFRGKARFLSPSPHLYYSGPDSSLSSPIWTSQKTHGESGEESRTRNEIHDGFSKSRGGAAFDRYGPGGWRPFDETLQGSVDCKRPGLFRHPKYCNKFYACNYDPWEERFTLHIFNCPIRLTYDNSISACNWPVGGPACANDNLLV